MPRLTIPILTLLTAAAVTHAADPPTPYTTFVDRYLAADWQKLSADISAAQKDLATLPKDQTADLAYIKQSLAECRPAWWDQTKLGKKIVIRPVLWGRTLSLTYDPALADGQVNRTAFGTTYSYSLYWKPDDMDSPAPAEHGFTKGDLMDMGIWQLVEKAGVISSVSQEKLAEWNTQPQFAYYLWFRGTIASGYYGTPRTRRWTCFLSLSAFAEHYAKAENFIPRKPFGAMIIAEIVGHPWKYPSLQIPNNAEPGNTEQTLAANFTTQFERTVLTLAEDKALRDVIKEFSTANMATIITTGKITLPNKLNMDLDPTKDADNLVTRNAWLVEQLSNPTTAPAATRAK